MKSIMIDLDTIMYTDEAGKAITPGTMQLLQALNKAGYSVRFLGSDQTDVSDFAFLQEKVRETLSAGSSSVISRLGNKWALNGKTLDSLRELLNEIGILPVKGFFLTVEGPDGSGKTTQVNLLERNLLRHGYEVLRTREPGGTPISEKIRKIILDPENMEMDDITEAMLYASARAQHVHQLIKPAIEDGKLILCDRFVDSSAAYQGGARGLGVETILEINKPAVGTTLPDATLYLRIDPEKALMRRLQASTPDRLESEAVSFHQKVGEAYEQLISMEPERFLIVDASADPETVSKEAWQKVSERLSEKEQENG